MDMMGVSCEDLEETGDVQNFPALFAKFRDSMQVVRCNSQHPILRAGSKFCSLVLFTLCDHLTKQTKKYPVSC